MAPIEALSSPTLVAAAIILLVFIGLYLTFAAFALVGFTPGEVLTLIFLAPLVSGINLPILQLDGLIIALNLAGVFIPLVLVLRFVYLERLPLGRTLLATGVVTVVAYLVSTPTDQGIIVMVYPVVLAAVVMTGVLTRARPGRTGPIAFTAGSMGTLIGADMLRISSLQDPSRSEPLVAAIGGAGTLDAIYIVGLIAVLFEIVAVAIVWLVRRRGIRPRTA